MQAVQSLPSQLGSANAMTMKMRGMTDVTPLIFSDLNILGKSYIRR